MTQIAQLLIIPYYPHGEDKQTARSSKAGNITPQHRCCKSKVTPTRHQQIKVIKQEVLSECYKSWLAYLKGPPMVQFLLCCPLWWAEVKSYVEESTGNIPHKDMFPLMAQYLCVRVRVKNKTATTKVDAMWTCVILCLIWCVIWTHHSPAGWMNAHCGDDTVVVGGAGRGGTGTGTRETSETWLLRLLCVVSGCQRLFIFWKPVREACPVTCSGRDGMSSSRDISGLKCWISGTSAL